MKAASIPAKFPIVWANTAVSPYIRTIPEASQIGITNGAASLTDGFPPLCFQPEAAGGTAFWGADNNGILQQITSWNQWQQAGGPIKYDATFSAAVGGYPAGAILSSASIVGQFWISTVDNNTSDPDTGGANWLTFYQGGRYSWNASNPPSSGVSLNPGDKATITISGFNGLFPMNIATASGGGVYHFIWSIYSSTSTNTDIGYLPNNTTVTNAFSNYFIQNGNPQFSALGTATSEAGFVDITVSPYNGNIPAAVAEWKSYPNFGTDFFAGPAGPDNINDIGPFILEAIVSTYTDAKMWKYQGGVHGGISIGFGIWEDTSTAWTSLGSLFCSGTGGNTYPPSSYATLTGTCYIERLV